MRLRLASYNVQKAVGTDLRRRPDRVLEVMASLGADILAVQEVDKRRHPRPSPFDAEQMRDATGLVPLAIGGTDVSMGHHGNVLLVRPDMRVIETRALDLPGLEPRGAAMARLAVGGEKLCIIGTHLGLLRRDRTRQSAALADLVSHLEDSVAILGDMNEWRTTGGLAPLNAAFDLVTPGPSYHAARPLASFDRAALSAMEVRDHGVLKTRVAHRASDHLPIWIDVSI